MLKFIHVLATTKTADNYLYWPTTLIVHRQTSKKPSFFCDSEKLESQPEIFPRGKKVVLDHFDEGVP